MEIKINKEIREYTESLFMGLTMRQCFFSVLACATAVMLYFLCIDTLGTELTSWICMIAAVPFAALGFVKYQGMTAEQIAFNTVRSLLLTYTDLTYQPYNFYYELMKEKQKREEREKKHDKKLRKIKKAKQG